MSKPKKPLLTADGGYTEERYKDNRKQQIWCYDMRHSLQRRTAEVARALSTYLPTASEKVLDIGTADSLMLRDLVASFPDTIFTGVDNSLSILRISPIHLGYKLQGDAMSLPFESNTFDVVVAAAVIEHLPDPYLFLDESHRILRADGLLILTTPNPFMDQIAEKVGIHKGSGSGHHILFSLKQLQQACEKHGFSTLEASKFMLSPISIPGEIFIERLLKKLKLDFIIANQLLVAQCHKGGK